MHAPKDLKYMQLHTCINSCTPTISVFRMIFQTTVKTQMGVVAPRSRVNSVSAHAQLVIEELQENDPKKSPVPDRST